METAEREPVTEESCLPPMPTVEWRPDALTDHPFLVGPDGTVYVYRPDACMMPLTRRIREAAGMLVYRKMMEIDAVYQRLRRSEADLRIREAALFRSDIPILTRAQAALGFRLWREPDEAHTYAIEKPLVYAPKYVLKNSVLYTIKPDYAAIFAPRYLLGVVRWMRGVSPPEVRAKLYDPITGLPVATYHSLGDRECLGDVLDQSPSTLAALVALVLAWEAQLNTVNADSPGIYQPPGFPDIADLFGPKVTPEEQPTWT